MKRKICVITGTRADYGLLRWLILEISKSSKLDLQIIATGMHLSPEFGLTYKEIENDGFLIHKKIEILLSSDSPVGVSKSIGLGLIGFSEAFADLSPDIILVLGDRFEILAATVAALISRIPVAHLHGGETTEGAFDEGIRHSITKMSHLHFVAANEYRNRVIQLGEDSSNVFLVGGMGIDGIKKSNLLKKEELESSLNIKLKRNNLLITFHPVTLEESTAKAQMVELLSSLETLSPETGLIFTMPNADTDGRIIFELVKEFTSSHSNAWHFTSLGQTRYLSCLQFVDAVVGNSSSGIIEAPSFKIGTINIGDRQKGRLKAKSIIDCEPKKIEIIDAFKRLYSSDFQKNLSTTVNPYGEGGASEKIVRILEKVEIQGILKKKFFDLQF
ncbi:UDP-N-acetylglucosamine 2-epimerase [Leptospira interrogans]|uniref:UDP-N-acetylglucosamine-2-epimerase NeuC n=1 Tax=Leptospira interrogans serovar Canicola TaxID=211880 RepID=D4HSI1_LEPIR|nr:UDP-N-acetylglucosamine 2-epimerase [Leptospira interrogans]ADC93864.1 UDP-N-acetylglucosamine-2-epimerase NeuC [Leptospira interrogans serovar Canicola]ASV06251.1 UDP-N-acetylglucosamine 2-epimerase (hydrolyzing) [Leptospira interrogans serovar Canicola]ASV09351.1 UDP-N-acetylglucosamine 2-epimerase (hydrolyzing) [Leptospira interrogans serovar Canicola]EKO67995.1 UDP-N-acetyl-D-glucosamine 2-epimerase, UDP-hydrolysing [Leptospira interrogans serovar Canicola str. Fiocruz LV133]EMK17977.1 